MESQRHEVLFDYIAEIGLFEYYEEVDDAEARERIANIEQLLNDIVSYMSESNNNTLAGYLERVTLISDLDTKSLNKDAITLMTLHSSKGLEFDHVFIPGIERNLFPIQRDKFEDDEEEERRLFYVGITRAKKTLHLTYVDSRIRFGNLMRSAPSVFLHEINPEVVCDINKNTFLTPKRDFSSLDRNNNFSKKQFAPLFSKNNSNSFFNDAPYQDDYSQIPVSQDVAPIKVGDVVKHSKFGTGRVLALTGACSDKRATDQFSLFGRKQLLLSFAKLKIVKQ